MRNSHRRRAGATRRRFIAGSVAAAALAAAFRPAAPAIAQTRTVKFGLSWLPEGGNLFAYLGRNRGFWKKRGLDVQLFTGRGSVAAAQTAATAQYEFGLAAAPAVVLQLARGLKIAIIGQVDYVATMGIGVLADSPIKSPKDLEGKKLGGTATSGEFPFLPAFFKRNGLDAKKIEIVQMDNQVRERSLLEKQVDAISGFASSFVPPLASRGIAVRSMLYADYGLDAMYSQALLTQPAYLAENPGLCEAFAEGAMEAIQACFDDPDAAIAAFMKEVPETAMKAGAKDFLELGLGIFLAKTLSADVRANGLGYMDIAKYEKLAELVVDYVATDAKKPAVAAFVSNKFVGRVKLSAKQIATGESMSGKMDKYLKI